MNYTNLQGTAPALLEALVEVEKRLIVLERMQQLLAFRLDGLRREGLGLAEAVRGLTAQGQGNQAGLSVLRETTAGALQAVEERLDLLEYLLSEEIGQRLTAPLRGPSERRTARPVTPDAGRNGTDSAFVHSPGYDQEPAEPADLA